MSDPPAQQASRFKAPSNLSTSERISTNTVGLVALSDFRKRRAEVLEQQEREARDALRTGSGASTPRHDTSEGGSRSGTPAAEDGAPGQNNKKKKKKVVKKAKKALVSFGNDEDEDDDDSATPVTRPLKKKKVKQENGNDSGEPDPESEAAGKDSSSRASKITANASVGFVPRAMTKAALRREATERDTLRKEFLALQEAIKNTEIVIPYVFYDGSNTPGGTVRVRKGEFVWVFLDNCRKAGAELAVGGEKNTNVRKEWARIGVDDLLLVRGTMIIPHHYEFYFFIMNKTLGPGNIRLFNYSAEAPNPAASSPNANGDSDSPTIANALSSAKGGIVAKKVVDISALEGANEDPTFTKVVDRRWYERNKHIYPASMWQEFDPEKDYTSEIRRDTGGNTFFFSK
ncbi:unnamed protein product [Discula destructiva]